MSTVYWVVFGLALWVERKWGGVHSSLVLKEFPGRASDTKPLIIEKVTAEVNSQLYMYYKN